MPCQKNQKRARSRLPLVFVMIALLAPPTGVCWGAEAESTDQSQSGTHGAFSWEMPGRVSIFDLQFGPAVYKNGEFVFQGDKRSLNIDQFPDRLTLAVRFSYHSSQSEVPLKFMIRLPDTRQYEETVRLPSRSGHYTYHFTIHNPRDFLGTGYIYLYYGFSIVDVLDFNLYAGR
ncbi:MAG: hypothetical protein ACP5M0_09710 [Desulfomonilaceae bacterium]